MSEEEKKKPQVELLDLLNDEKLDVEAEAAQHRENFKRQINENTERKSKK